MFRYLPEQGSELAPKIDFVNHLITDLSVFFTAAVVGAMLYFAIRYRRTPQNPASETPQIKDNHFLEIIWTVVPTIISAFVAYMGLIYFYELRSVPKDAMTINVVAKKWDWSFEYSNGKKTLGEFVVPVDKPVRLLMQSRDVLHSLYIPGMRVKADVIPGRYTYVSFKPVRTGEYHTFCTEYCGASHWNMRAELKVVSQTEYDAWLNDKSAELRANSSSPAERGAAVFKAKGCTSCHSLGTNRIVGPGLAGIFGEEHELEGGATVKVDENYIKTSILNPAAQIRKGYPNAMTPFAGLVTDAEVDDLIALIKGLEKSAAPATPEVAVAAVDLSKLTPAERGHKIMEGKACLGCHSVDGSALVGPTYKGIYGRKGKLADGSDYVADDAYIKESILNPTAKVVQGFAPAMPPYAGQLSDDDIKDITEYLKTVK